MRTLLLLHNSLIFVLSFLLSKNNAILGRTLSFSISSVVASYLYFFLWCAIFFRSTIFDAFSGVIWPTSSNAAVTRAAATPLATLYLSANWQVTVSFNMLRDELLEDGREDGCHSSSSTGGESSGTFVHKDLSLEPIFWAKDVDALSSNDSSVFINFLYSLAAFFLCFSVVFQSIAPITSSLVDLWSKRNGTSSFLINIFGLQIHLANFGRHLH